MVIIAIILIGFPLLIIIIETMRKINKHFALKRVFNLNRELKNLKEQSYKPKKNNIKKSKTGEIIPTEQTYLGKSNNKKDIYIPNNAKHVFVCGTTGSGKTAALSNFIESAVNNNYPAVIIDGKGDTGTNSLTDITNKLGKDKKIYTINLNNPKKSDKYNPFKNGSPSMIKDMLINMTDWSEEHYKLNTERYLQRLINTMYKTDIPLSFTNIIKHIPVNMFVKISGELAKEEKITKEEHTENVGLAKTSGKIAENASARFSTIIESEIGEIFTQDGTDISTAIEENSIILFILNPLIYPELSPLFGRLILIDSKKAVQKQFGKTQRVFYIFDEINVYSSPALLDLVNKSRSANITCVLATQSLSDLDFTNGEYFKEQIIENCNNYIVLRQNSAVNAENWANILGTRKNLDVTFQITNNKGGFTDDTGYGSARQVRQFLYHPDEIKTFSAGQGIFMCKDNNTHSKILINKPF
jgi:type IV secretory pathway TraG/TraD family ATPase VirD4